MSLNSLEPVLSLLISYYWCHVRGSLSLHTSCYPSSVPYSVPLLPGCDVTYTPSNHWKSLL